LTRILKDLIRIMNNDYWSYNELIPATKEEKEEHLNYEIWMFRKTCDQLNAKLNFLK